MSRVSRKHQPWAIRFISVAARCDPMLAAAAAGGLRAKHAPRVRDSVAAQAWIGRTAVGHVELALFPDGAASIRACFIRPGFRGLGLGLEFRQWIEAWFRARRVESRRLAGMPAADE